MEDDRIIIANSEKIEKLNEKLESSVIRLYDKVDEILLSINTLSNKVVKISMILQGPSGDNGLSSKIKKNSEDIQSLRKEGEGDKKFKIGALIKVIGMFIPGITGIIIAIIALQGA